MQKLFIDYIPEDIVTLDENQSRHVVKSLRMKKGDIITLCDGRGNDYGAMIECDTLPVTLKICYKQASGSEPTVTTALYQGLPKGDKMDDIVQKSVEVGVTEIYPIMTCRSISRPDKKAADKKIQRWNKIALEAAQQSGRGIVPTVHPLISFDEAIKNQKSDVALLFYEGGGESLKNIVKKDVKSISVFIGPEGGFDKEEVKKANEVGIINATLGKRILRTETAPITALSVIMSLTDNM